MVFSPLGPLETLLRYLEGSHGQTRLPLAFLSFHLVEQLDSSYRQTWTLHWPKLAESKFPNNLANVAFVLFSRCHVASLSFAFLSFFGSRL